VNASSFGTYRTDAVRRWDVSGAPFENQKRWCGIHCVLVIENRFAELGNARSYRWPMLRCRKVGSASGAAPSAWQDRDQFTSRQDL
jgi:hypothetical protein